MVIDRTVLELKTTLSAQLKLMIQFHHWELINVKLSSPLTETEETGVYREGQLLEIFASVNPS